MVLALRTVAKQKVKMAQITSHMGIHTDGRTYEVMTWLGIMPIV